LLKAFKKAYSCGYSPGFSPGSLLWLSLKREITTKTSANYEEIFYLNNFTKYFCFLTFKNKKILKKKWIFPIISSTFKKYFTYMSKTHIPL